MSKAEGSPDMFHGKFIPDEEHPLPIMVRICIGIGVGLLIFVVAALCLNVLNHLGVWLTLLIISAFTTGSLVVWIRDAVLHPATSLDDTE